MPPPLHLCPCCSCCCFCFCFCCSCCSCSRPSCPGSAAVGCLLLLLLSCLQMMAFWIYLAERKARASQGERKRRAPKKMMGGGKLPLPHKVNGTASRQTACGTRLSGRTPCLSHQGPMAPGARFRADAHVGSTALGPWRDPGPAMGRPAGKPLARLPKRR